MQETTARTAMLIGEAGVETLQNSFVALVGLGGVGGHCAEALARAGIGRLLVIDADTIDASNLNRQLIATKHNIGEKKATAMQARIEAVSACRVDAVCALLSAQNVNALLPPALCFIVDAVDDVKAKLAIAAFAQQNSIPLVSAMGAGNRLDPTAFYVTDIYQTQGCPLARAMRQGCRKQGIARLPVVISRETPRPASGACPGSISFVPAAAGLALAGYVVNSLLAKREE